MEVQLLYRKPKSKTKERLVTELMLLRKEAGREEDVGERGLLGLFCSFGFGVVWFFSFNASAAVGTRSSNKDAAV